MNRRSLKDGPDFLCIGAQKAGTSWLYSNLKKHPQVLMPPLKEIHYYDEIHRGVRRDVIGRLRDRHWMNRLWRRYTINRLREDIQQRSVALLRWHIRYFLFPRGSRWYLSLFRRPAGLLSGDITPDYSLLERQLVMDVHRRLPDARIVFFMRDPVDRFWSSLKMNFIKWDPDGAFRYADEAELFERYMGNEEAFQLGDYRHTLTTWEEFYPPGQFFVGFFEELRSDPVDLLSRLHRFLGLEDRASLDADGARRIVNAGTPDPMPARCARYLSEKYLPMLEWLVGRFAGGRQAIVKGWLERARKTVYNHDAWRG